MGSFPNKNTGDSKRLVHCTSYTTNECLNTSSVREKACLWTVSATYIHTFPKQPSLVEPGTLVARICEEGVLDQLMF